MLVTGNGKARLVVGLLVDDNGTAEVVAALLVDDKEGGNADIMDVV